MEGLLSTGPTPSSFLMIDILRVQTPNDTIDDDLSDGPLISLKCETMSPTTDWKKSWRLVRSKGLGPELTSFTLKILWRIIPTRSRLHRILPIVYQNPDCQLCGTPQTRRPETLDHALYTCQANQGLPAKLLSTLQRYQPGAVQCTVLTLDLELEPSLELPFTWVIGSLLFSIWTQRENGRVDPARTRAHLEAKCRILRDSKAKSWANASKLTEAIIKQIFNE